LQQLRHDEAAPDLLQQDVGLGTPQESQAEVLFQQQKRALDVPAPRRELGNVVHAEQLGIAHIGDVAMQDALMQKAHQAHGVPGTRPFLGA